MGGLFAKAELAVALALLVLGAAWGYPQPLAIGGVAWMAREVWRHARRVRQRADLLAPQLWLSAAYAIVFGLGSARLLWLDPSRHLEQFLWVATGFVALQLGTGRLDPDRQIATPDIVRAFPVHVRRFRWLMALWIFGGVLAGLAYYLRSGGLAEALTLGESGRVALAESGGAALRLLMYSLLPWGWWALWDRRNQRHLPGWLVWGGLGLAVGLITVGGNRAPLVMLGAVGVLVYAAWPVRLERFRARLWIWLGLAACLAGLAFGAWGGWRLANDPRTARYPEIHGPISAGRWLALSVEQSLGYIGHGSANLAVVLEAVPQYYPHRYGASYFDPFTTVLPGRQLTLDMQLKEALRMRFTGGGFVPSLLGEAYINFGWPGFLLVPALVGLALRRLHARWRRQGGAATGLVYLVLLYYLSVHMVSGILASSILMPWLVALIVASARLFKKRQAT